MSTCERSRCPKVGDSIHEHRRRRIFAVRRRSALAAPPDADRMRIAIDGHSLIPPRAGIGQYTYHLIRALARLEPGHQYLVMYPRLTRTLRTREAPAFAEKCVRVVSEGRLQFLWFRARRKLRRKLGMAPPVERSIGSFDVYHATNYVFTHTV